MKIDLHTHSKIGSGCGKQSVSQIVEAAIGNGMDAVCLTDHNEMSGREAADEASRKWDFPVFTGMEVSVREGHILAFGPLLEEGYGDEGLKYSEFRRIIDLESFALIPAHPFRGGAPKVDIVEVIMRYFSEFAALEAYSFNMTDKDSENTIHLARLVGLPLVAGSDSHAPERPAGSYFTALARNVNTVSELVNALKAGDFEAGAPLYAAAELQE